MKKFDRRIKRLEEKATAIVIQQFLKRMRNAKDDASKIFSIGWELLNCHSSLGRKIGLPTAEAFLDALPAGHSIAIRRHLSELAAKQTGDKE